MNRPPLIVRVAGRALRWAARLAWSLTRWAVRCVAALARLGAELAVSQVLAALETPRGDRTA